MTTIICDSSSLIDIDKTGLLAKALLMPYCYVIPDMVAEELKILPQSRLQDIRRNGLQVVRLSGDQASWAWNLHQRRQSLTIEDCSLLSYARNTGSCILLTADKKLRNEAERSSITVRGTLWLLERLLATSAVRPALLHRELLALKSDSGVFLPDAAIDALIDRCLKS